MSYDRNTPQPTDIPRDSQDEFVTNYDILNNIFGVNHIPFTRNITIATNASPCVITITDHKFTTGEMVQVYGLKGTNDEGQERLWSIDGDTFSITVLTVDTFSIPVDTSTENTYLANTGNVLNTTITNYYGTHKKVSFAGASLEQGRASPIVTVNPITVKRHIVNNEEIPTWKLEDIPELHFQNSTATLLRLTGFNPEILVINVQIASEPVIFMDTFLYGFTTPWGLKINFGYRVGFADPVASPTRVFALPKTYSTDHYFTVITRHNGRASERMRVTSTSLTDFAITTENFSSVASATRLFSFMSWGI